MKARFLILAFLCLTSQVYAQQQIIFQTTQTKSWLLTYSASGDESQRVINEMLSAIATYVPKPVYQTKVTFNVDEHIKITKERNKVNVYAIFQNISLSGDVFYKTFDMTDVLVPSKYEFSGTLTRDKGVFLLDYTHPKSVFTPPYSEVKIVYEDSVASGTYEFKITSVAFQYDATALNRFRDKVTLIDQYFTADLDLNSINEQLKSINPDHFEALEQNQEALNNVKRNADNIAAAAFWQGLRVENYDPLKLHAKMYDIRNRINDLQARQNYTQSVVHQLYYDKALSLYKMKKTAEARQNFEKSLSYSPAFGPSQYYLALIAWEEKKIDESKQHIRKLFTFKNLDADTYKAGMELAHALEWTDMNIAAGLLNNGRFQDALNALVKAEEFCRGIQGYTCNDTIELIRGDCHRGLYADKVRKSTEALNMKKLDEAEKEVESALDYQKQYGKYIPDNAEALALKERIKIEQYYVAVAKGKDYMNQKSYRSAFAEFRKATDIEALYPVKKDKQLPELLKKSKLEVMFLDLDEAERLVAVNDLVRARDMLRTAIDDQKTYLLTDNQKLSQRIENLRKSIFTQECNNAQKAYDNKIAEASTAVADKLFIKAESLYKEALQITESNRDCGINGELGLKGKEAVAKPAEYQRQLEQCNELVRTVRYGQAIEAYLKLTDYYDKNDIRSSGLVHQPLQLYINSFESNFLLFSIDWYIGQRDLENAWFLMKQLRQRNLPAKLAKMQQANLARALAVRDYQANPGIVAKVKVTEYTLGDKWYKVFTKEYVKQVKKLS